MPIVCVFIVRVSEVAHCLSCVCTRVCVVCACVPCVEGSCVFTVGAYVCVLDSH